MLGPGPARYALPPALGQKEHDLRKWRAPAYSLSGITRPFKGNGVPGKTPKMKKQDKSLIFVYRTIALWNQ